MTGAADALAVRVRYFAGARAATGVDEEILRVAAETDGTVTAAGVIDAIRQRHGQALAGILAACSFLLDGAAVRDRGAAVGDGAEFDVLPPFAGG